MWTKHIVFILGNPAYNHCVNIWRLNSVTTFHHFYSWWQVNSKTEAPPTSFHYGRANAGEKATSSPAFALPVWRGVGGASTLL